MKPFPEQSDEGKKELQAYPVLVRLGISFFVALIIIGSAAAAVFLVLKYLGDTPTPSTTAAKQREGG